MLKRITVYTLLIICGLVQNGLFAQFSSTDIVGEWLTEEGDSKVAIYREGSKFFGKVIWLEDPNDEDGLPFRDAENPDPSLRSRKIQGLVVLKDFTFDGEEWGGGVIYDPKNGKTYKCYMDLEERNKLKIRGYIGKSWMGLGRTTYWTQ